MKLLIPFGDKKGKLVTDACQSAFESRVSKNVPE